MAVPNIPTYKVILLGTIDVGKTSLIVRIAEGIFPERVENFDKKDVVVNVSGKPVKLQITDTAGQERFRTLTSSYFRKAQAMIIVYDISNEESFSDLEGYIKEGVRYSERSEKFIVGNKLDLEAEGLRKVEKSQGQSLADKEGFPFYEVSAKTGAGVQELFEAVARKLLGAEQPEAPPSNTVVLQPATIDKTSGTGGKEKKKGPCVML